MEGSSASEPQAERKRASSGASPISFGAIHEHNLEQLRLLNSVIFPVKYNDKFYTDILTTPPDFTKYAYWNGFVVGAICCRIEPADGGARKLYIMTLGVLAAYRGHGIGTKLLKSALAAVPRYPELDEIYLHVQTSNTDAINFYAKHGFRVKDMIKNYYKRIEPPDCYVLSKDLRQLGGQDST